MFTHLKRDFPFFARGTRNRVPIYFDNAATTHKPAPVLHAMYDFYTQYNANIHRGIYATAERATEEYERVRNRVANFIGAQPHEIVFTSGTTAGINAVASAWAEKHIHAGDHITITELEHHANMLPWLQCAQAKKAALEYILIDPNGMLQLDRLDEFIHERTKLVAICSTSNALGVHNDVIRIGDRAREVGAFFLVDAAQTIAHERIDVKQWDCDALVFSGHKLLGPTGIGVLYLHERVHEQLVPYQYGGGMVFEADFYNATWRSMPHMLEAGTPPIASVIGLGASIEYLDCHIDFQKLRDHEAQLCARFIDHLSLIPRVSVLGPLGMLKERGHVVSFCIDGVHAHDVAAYLAAQDVYVRAGHQCAQPLARRLGVPAAVRASFYLYNTLEEVDICAQYIEQIIHSDFTALF